MEDQAIIALYWARDESAVSESQTKYGTYCTVIAENILHAPEDSAECVNDTWLRAWNAIPPEKPRRLATFFGRITRNLAIDRFRRGRTQKYGGGQTALCLDELRECIGESQPIEDKIALKILLDAFLSSLPDKHREMFLLRYWYLMPTADIAARFGMTVGAVKMLLQRIRAKLRAYLEKEGIDV